MSTNRIIKWNIQDKERRDAEHVDNQKTIAQIRVKQLVGKIWQSWKKGLKTALKTQTLPEYHAKLRVRVMNALSDAGLDEFTNMTETMLNDIAERLNAAAVNGQPIVTPVQTLPNFFAPTGEPPIPFHTEEEFMEIPAIQKWVNDPACMGIVTENTRDLYISILGPYLAGIKQTLAFAPLGSCMSSKGIGKFPTKAEFLEGLRSSETRAPDGSASASPQAGSEPPSASTPTTPEPPATETGNTDSPRP